jgi:thiamine biosynthesis lipoprotein
MRNCTRYNITKWMISTLLTIICTAGCNNRKAAYQTIDGFAQGGTYHIVYQPSANSMEANLPDSLAQYFHNIYKSLSGYDTTSLVSRINRGENPKLDDLFIECFNISKQVWEETSGAVDVSGGPLFDIWGFGFREKIEITPQMIDSVKQFIGMDKLSIIYDSTANANFLHKADPRMKLNFNAIAQGYTCDYIAGKFNSMGIENYLIEVGGEIICKGVNRKGKEWNVAIDKPIDGNFIPGNSIQTIIEISNCGLVTSGNYRKFYIQDGEKYSHTIDPASGYPVRHNLLSATVIAESAAIADAYATYLMVIGLDKAVEFLDNQSSMEALLVYSQGEDLKVHSTKGVHQRELK